jgi:hypothetical protein
MVAMKALGMSPLAWQLFGIAAWTLIVLLALGILRGVWPARRLARLRRSSPADRL